MIVPGLTVFCDELARTYRVLRPDDAELQNHVDIKLWLSQGLISYDEAMELHIVNFKLSRAYR